MMRLTMTALALLAAGFVQAGSDADFDARLQAVQQEWAVANYEVPDAAAREGAFEALAGKAAALSGDYPQRAEALIWEGIVLSTYAGAKGGLGALGLAKQARRKLDAALEIDATALDGSAYTSLGTLYHKVPGFPVGFGSDKKARDYLQKALALNPDGMDANYFYGEYLFDKGEYGDALQYLERGLAAPPRPGRELADEGRRHEIESLIEKVRAQKG